MIDPEDDDWGPGADPRIKTLAKEAAHKIKSLNQVYDTQIEEIYRDFRQQAAAIREESSADRLDNSSAAPDPTTDSKQS